MNVSARQVITSRQLLYLLLVSTFPTEAVMQPGPLIAQFGKDALYSIATGAAYACLPLLLVIYTLRMLQGRSIVEALSSVAGRILLSVFGVAVLLTTTNIWGSYHVLLTEDLLPHTPAWALVLASLGVVLYGISGGAEVLGRMAELLTPIIIFGVLGIWLLALPWYHIEHLLPLQPQHAGIFSSGALKILSFLGEVGFGSYLGGFVRDRKNIPRALTLALLWNTVVILCLTSKPLLLFSTPHAALMTFPPINAMRAIHYGFLIERIDTLLVPAWIVLVSIKLMLWGIIGGDMLAAALHIRRYARVAQAGIALTALFSLRLQNMADVHTGVSVIGYRLFAPALLLTVLVGALASRSRSRRSSTTDG